MAEKAAINYTAKVKLSIQHLKHNSNKNVTEETFYNEQIKKNH